MNEKSPIVEIAKNVCPAVITVVVSRDLPKIESFYSFPFGGKEYLMPKMEKIKGVKERYNQLDEPTKNKIKTGLAGTAALLIGVAAIKKARRAKRRD